MRFRIAKRDGHYYPQVKKWFRWYRIGVHVHGFGLYDHDDYEHPKTLAEAIYIIDEYKKWKSLNPEVSYIEL